MAVANRISEQEYRALALADADHLWERWDGVPREKPLLSMKHDNVSFYLGLVLANQLDRGVYRVDANGGKTRLSSRNYYIPDVVVIPAAYQTPFEHDPRAFNAHADPLPLVEIWSLTTGHYDVATKLPGYRERGTRRSGSSTPMSGP